MTDRELLELAAKAAGYGPPGPDDHDEIGRQELDGLWVKFSWGWGWWRPLAHDGDALRLAVKLRLTVSWDRFDDDDYATATPRHTHQGYDCIAGSDPYAATRLAIVRAAAEIGRSME